MSNSDKHVPSKFQDRTESYDIEKTVQKIQEQRSLYKPNELKQMHSDFATDNPELFKKCCDEKLKPKDFEYLVFILKLRQQVKRKEITFQEANSIVAIHFAEQIQPELLSKDGFKNKK